jgi:hypothetical protein
MTSIALTLALATVPSVQPSGNETTLGEPYRDGTFGFSIRPPCGWQVIRERKVLNVGLTVLRLVNQAALGRTFEFSVRLSQTPEPITFQSALDELSQALMAEQKNTVINETRSRTIAGKSAGFLSASFDLDGQRTIFLATIVQSRPQQYILILYSGPLDTGSVIQPVYDAVVDSFRILDDEKSDETLRRALLDGTDWLNALTPARLRALPTFDTWLGAYQGSELVGFREVGTEFGEIVTGVRRLPNGKEQLLKLEGVRVREQGWIFAPNGACRREFNEMFVTEDLQIERWRNVTLLYSPASAGRRADVSLSLEEGAKESGQIITSQRYGVAAPPTPNPPIPAPPTYAPRALLAVLPQLAGDLGNRRLLAFHEFDHAIRGMVVRTVELLGPTPSRDATSTRKFYRLRQREGLVGPPMDAYTTPTGRVVKLTGGALTFKLTKREKLHEVFARRIEEAEKAIADVDREYVELQK